MNAEEVKPLRGYSDNPEFYVYVHRKPDRTIFYVGKGKGKRAYSKANRNKHWKHVVDKYPDYLVEIVEFGLVEEDAFNLEKFLIEFIGIEKLTNQTLGGVSTTGYRHTSESKQLQSKIARDRLKERPDLLDACRKRLSKLHELQRSDDDYRSQLSLAQKNFWNNLSEQEKLERTLVKTAWVKSPEGRSYISEQARIRMQDPVARENISQKVKVNWQRLSEKEREARSEILSTHLNSPEVRSKMLEVECDKIVVNRQCVFTSKTQFLNLINSHHTVLIKAFRSASKFNFSFAITNGFFVENYDDLKHKTLPYYNGEHLSKLNFDCLPRSKAVVMDEYKVFLSMTEASTFCNGKTVNATADFITKNMKLNKPAMGHYWRVATPSEIEKEIINRLLTLGDNK